MARYIDADKLLNERTIFIQDEEGFDIAVVAVADIELALTADVAEVKHGEWIVKKKWQSGKWHKWLECSCCGAEDWNYRMYKDMPFCELPNFCPHCGAKNGRRTRG